MKHSRTISRSSSFFALAVAAGLMAAPVLGLAADDAFVKKAGMGGAGEVAAGKLAQTEGSTDAVKQFGSRMVDDHTKAGDELKSIAQGKSMSVPAQADPAHMKALAGLEKKSGTNFDKAFKAQMVKDHKDTIALFEKESKAGKDADLKAFAGKTLPTLREHLKMAEAL